jgi:hypothetical protein
VLYLSFDTIILRIDSRNKYDVNGQPLRNIR